MHVRVNGGVWRDGIRHGQERENGGQMGGGAAMGAPGEREDGGGPPGRHARQLGLR